MTTNIPFNRPAVTGVEKTYLAEVLQARKFSGGGPFSTRCNAWLQQRFEASKCLTTSSATHALEMAALLCDLGPGDEVILPSFAFSSTANAFARCGARLVFVDVEPATMNIDPQAVDAAVTKKTKVIVAMHYAGVSCKMDELNDLARRHGLLVVEDAAQAIFSEYRGKACGTLGTFGCFSFHETKNLQCGEGGALLVNDARFSERAEIIWEKGTDRVRFFRGEVDKYTWQDIGSSYVLGELNSAFLLAQLERGKEITEERLSSWNRYSRLLEPLDDLGFLEIPRIPLWCRHNGHIFWIKTRDSDEQISLLEYLKEQGIHSIFHYLPLHSSAAGKRYGRFAGEDRHTTKDAGRLIRLPLFDGFSENQRIATAIGAFYGVA